MQKKQAAKKSVVKLKANRKAKLKTKPKTKPRAKSPARASADFGAVFEELKKVMGTVAPQLRVIDDQPEKYSLVTQSKSWRGGPMFFGAITLGKAYVSYHLMALYVCPELTKEVPLGLGKRKQGKACFNFRAPDVALFAELRDLTKAGLEKYRAKNWL